MLNKYKAEEIKKAKPRYIIIKLPKTSDEEKNLRSNQRKKCIPYRRTKKKMTAKFSLETLQATKQCNDIY